MLVIVLGLTGVVARHLLSRELVLCMGWMAGWSEFG